MSTSSFCIHEVYRLELEPTYVVQEKREGIIDSMWQLQRTLLIEPYYCPSIYMHKQTPVVHVVMHTHRLCAIECITIRYNIYSSKQFPEADDYLSSYS